MALTTLRVKERSILHLMDPPTSASPLRTPTAGMRSCRRDRQAVPAGHALPTLHRRTSGPLPAIWQTYTGSTSTVSPQRTRWQLASCLHVASDARGSDTSRGTISSGERCLLLAPAQLVPQKAGNDALSRSVSWATGRILRATHRAWLGLC